MPWESVAHSCAVPEGVRLLLVVGFYLIHFKTFNPAYFHQVLMSPTLFLYIWSSKKQQKSGSALSLPLPCWVTFSPGKDRNNPPLNEFLAGKTSCLVPSSTAPKALLGQTSVQSSQDSRRMAEPLQLQESQLLREKVQIGKVVCSRSKSVI